MDYTQYKQSQFTNEADFIQEQINNTSKVFLNQLYQQVGSYMPVLLPIVRYITQNLMNFRILTSILIIYFNLKKIRTLWKLYLIFHIIIISIYAYNRTVVKLVNEDIPLLYAYMNKHGAIEKTLKNFYHNYFLRALSLEHREMVDGFISQYFKPGLQIILFPLKSFIIKTLQDIEGFLHSL